MQGDAHSWRRLIRASERDLKPATALHAVISAQKDMWDARLITPWTRATQRARWMAAYAALFAYETCETHRRRAADCAGGAAGHRAATESGRAGGWRFGAGKLAARRRPVHPQHGLW